MSPAAISRLLEICDETIDALIGYQEKLDEHGCEAWVSPLVVEKLAVRVAAVREARKLAGTPAPLPAAGRELRRGEE